MSTKCHREGCLSWHWQDNKEQEAHPVFSKWPSIKEILSNDWCWNLLPTNGKNKEGHRPRTLPYLQRTWRTWNKEKDHLGHNFLREEEYLPVTGAGLLFFPFPLSFVRGFLPSRFIFRLKNRIQEKHYLIVSSHGHSPGRKWPLTFSTEIIFPWSSVLCRWLMHFVASSAVDIVTKP